MKRYLVLLLLVLAGFAQASEITHVERVKIGDQTLAVGFSEYPPKAERSIDLTFTLEPTGIVGKKGKLELQKPNGERYFRADFLPRFPRDRNVWGFDSLALPEQGTWKLAIEVIGVGKSSIEIPVLERPAGPSNNLIYALSSLPMLAMLLLGLRAWLRVRPLRQNDANTW